jgi:hypothetical protein
MHALAAQLVALVSKWGVGRRVRRAALLVDCESSVPSSSSGAVLIASGGAVPTSGTGVRERR